MSNQVSQTTVDNSPSHHLNVHPTPEPSQAPGLSMGRRLFIPNPIATQSITGMSLMEYGICSSYSSGSSFWHGSYTTKRIVSEYAVHDVKVVIEGDAAEFPSISVERSVALAECDRLQLCQPVATIGAPEENR
jgi:hypothetical protein